MGEERRAAVIRVRAPVVPGLVIRAAVSLASVTRAAVTRAGMVHPGGHPGGGFHGHHNIGERGYSFRVGGPGRREIRFFSPREHELWRAGHWHHEMRFGRLGYWYEVDGAWYFYDRPFDGPPTYVSEVEFFDPDLGPPAAVAPAPVLVAPAPVVVVPPAVCVGPLCIR
jgi:hypothetical protein